jgi:hypothetical protein
MRDYTQVNLYESPGNRLLSQAEPLLDVVMYGETPSHADDALSVGFGAHITWRVLSGEDPCLFCMVPDPYGVVVSAGDRGWSPIHLRARHRTRPFGSSVMKEKEKIGRVHYAVDVVSCIQWT